MRKVGVVFLVFYLIGVVVMAVYNNEEEQKRRKVRKAPARMTVSIPGDPIFSPEEETESLSRQYASFKEKRPKSVAQAAGQLFGSTRRTAGEVASGVSQAGEAAREVAIETPKRIYGRMGEEFSRAYSEAAGVDDDGFVPDQDVRQDIVAAPPSRRIVSQGDKFTSDTAGTGTIQTPSGTIRVSPSGQVSTVGRPVVAPGPQIDESVEGGVRRRVIRGAGTGGADKIELSPVRRRRMVVPERQDAGPVRVTEAPVEPLRRISDIPEPKTIGGVPVYRRQVEALQADIDAQQRADQLAQRQQQFEAGQEQQQQQFEVDTALKARQLAGTEQRQQAELELRQQQEASRQKQQEQLDAAINQFTAAKTPQERNKAAAMINVMSGKGLKAEKSPAPAWKPKEVSDAVGAFEESFNEAKAGGLIEKDASFHRVLAARDPGLYRAVFGNMSPKAAEFGDRILTYPLDKLKADPEFKRMLEAMGDDADPEQLRAQLISDYWNLSEGR
jgi:hypothetical protein